MRAENFRTLPDGGGEVGEIQRLRAALRVERDIVAELRLEIDVYESAAGRIGRVTLALGRAFAAARLAGRLVTLPDLPDTEQAGWLQVTLDGADGLAARLGLNRDTVSGHIAAAADAGILRAWLQRRSLDPQTGAETRTAQPRLYVRHAGEYSDLLRLAAECRLRPRPRPINELRCEAHPDAQVTRQRLCSCAVCGRLLTGIPETTPTATEVPGGDVRLAK
jgi:hypothetical protein